MCYNISELRKLHCNGAIRYISEWQKLLLAFTSKYKFNRKQVEIMTYNEAMQYIEQVQKKGSVLGLGPVKMLLERLGNPQDKLSVIHVAGTNGKGSICTFLESMYVEEGKRVGRYISPTIHCYLERFQINGNYMEEDTFAKLLVEVIKVLEDMEAEQQPLPTAFEIETAIAFLYFLRENVDIVILETGMGGRLDATNVVAKPLCTVFASIGMDHMQFLGDTIEKIAYEKAGIMKAGCPVVSYPNSSEVINMLKDEFGLHNASWGEDRKDDVSLHNVIGGVVRQEDISLQNVDKTSQEQQICTEFVEISKGDITILAETLEGSRFLYKGEEYEIGMSGSYQIYNAVTAIETKLLLDGNVVKSGLRKATWEGRFEKISDEPLFIRDGAHNVDGVMALKESLQKHFTNHHIIFIIGVLGDKEYESMMEMLCPMAQQVFTITPPVERGLSGEVLCECVGRYCPQVETCADIEQAIKRAKQVYAKSIANGEQPVIVAWGSLSYIGQICIR